MGQEALLLFSKEDKPKVQAIIEKVCERGDDCWWLKGPDLDGYDFGCWLGWKRTQLQIGHQSHAYKGAWAKAVALEICKRVMPQKTGWDSVGYFDKDEFLGTKSCDTQIEMREDVLDGCDEEMKKTFKQEIRRLKRYQKIMMAKATELFKECN